MDLGPSRRPSAGGNGSRVSGDAEGDERDDGEHGVVSHLNRFVMGERSKKRKVWEFLLLVMLLYIALWFPYSLAFEHFRLRSDPHAPCELYVPPTHMIIWDWIVYAFFLVDFILNFFLTYRTSGHTSVEVFDIRMIAANYLRFFFWVNAVACLPAEAFEPIIVASTVDPGGCTYDPSVDADNEALSANAASRWWRVPRATKLAQMARLVRIVKVGSIIKVVDLEQNLRVLNSSRGVRALNWIAGLMWVVHMMACGWYLVAAMHTDHQLTWVASRGLLEEPGVVQWSHAMYFILTIFTTVGFGDMSAYTVGEICYVVLVMIIGAVVHSITMGEVISLVFAADSSTMWKRRQMKMLESYGDDTSLPEKTVVSLCEFVRHLDMRGGAYDQKHMYRFFTEFTMPRKLLGELPTQLFNGFLLRNKLVTTCARTLGGELPPRFPLLLATLLYPQVFREENVVYQMHDHSFHIYLVMSGIFCYVGEVEDSDFGRNAFVDASRSGPKNMVLMTSQPTGRKQLRDRPTRTVNPGEGRRLYSSREAENTSSMLEQGFSAWTPKHGNGEPWLQVDLGTVKKVKGIVMQGHPKEDQWVKKYKVQYSLLEEGPWAEIDDVFVGCADRSTESLAEFAQVPARFVRVLPVEWHRKISARVGVSAVAPRVYSYRVFNKMDFFGEEVLMGDPERTRTRHATARCDTAGEVLILHKRDLLPNGSGARLLSEFPEFQPALRAECARRHAQQARRLQWLAASTRRCSFAAAGGLLRGEPAGGAANCAAYSLQIAWRRYSAAKAGGEARGNQEAPAPPSDSPSDFESRFLSLIGGLAAEVKELKTRLALLTDGDGTSGTL